MVISIVIWGDLGRYIEPVETIVKCGISAVGRPESLAGPTAYVTPWTEFRAPLERHRDAHIAANPVGGEEIGLVHTALVWIGQLIRAPPSSWNGAMWKHLDGAAHREMVESRVQEVAEPNEEFR